MAPIREGMLFVVLEEICHLNLSFGYERQVTFIMFANGFDL